MFYCSLYIGGSEQTEQSVFGRALAVNRSLSRQRRLPPPTAFKRHRASRAPVSKVVKYVRDILCLPKAWIKNTKHIAVPRGERRSLLANAGLIGKIEFDSNMSDREVRLEICKAFSKPMGLAPRALENDELFPFKYLQRTGAGSRTLCVPSVAESFTWSGKQVATLAKSGGIIYILAEEVLLVEINFEVCYSIPQIKEGCYIAQILGFYLGIFVWGS